MFNGWIIAIALVSTLVPALVLPLFEKLGWERVLDLLVKAGTVASLYCVVAGLYLLLDWRDPLDDVDQMALAQSVHHPRGGFVILLIRFWPYALIGWGGYVAYSYLVRMSRTW